MVVRRLIRGIRAGKVGTTREELDELRAQRNAWAARESAEAAAHKCCRHGCGWRSYTCCGGCGLPCTTRTSARELGDAGDVDAGLSLFHLGAVPQAREQPPASSRQLTTALLTFFSAAEYQGRTMRLHPFAAAFSSPRLSSPLPWPPRRARCPRRLLPPGDRPFRVRPSPQRGSSAGALTRRPDARPGRQCALQISRRHCGEG